MTRAQAVGITGCGKYLPKNRVTNAALAQECGVTPDWIETHTGIQSRHYAAPEETASFMASAAAKSALQNAGIKAEDLGLIIGCTYSSENLFPGTACSIQQKLNAVNAGVFDLSSGSAGFEAAITAASDRMLADPEIKHTLVAAVSVQSPFLKKGDAKTAVIFGDGAAAVILSAVPKNYGLEGTVMFSKPEGLEAIRLERGGTIEMDGLAVGRHYMKHQPVVIERLLKKTGLTMKDISLFIFHQANGRILSLLASKLKIEPGRTFANVEKYGNTSDASVALALCEAVEAKKIKRGDRVLLSGVGPGMTFAASLLRWY